MKKGLIITTAVLIVIFLSIGLFAGKYNGMVNMEENINGKWAQVENQLQRRLDLIPNLVSTVKGYAAHEQETFTQVTEARSKVANAGSIQEKAEANSALSSALSRLMVVVERYPELKANQNFIRLQDELAGTENRLAIARKDYNEAVQSFIASIKIFPNNLVAAIFNFDLHEYFKADDQAREVPKVEF